MEFKNPEKFWKSKNHRKIGGARGARFMSLKGHIAFAICTIGGFQYVLRADDISTYKTPPPPVEAPAPLNASLGYSLTSEMPYLRRLETERSRPGHVPDAPLADFRHLREGKLLDGSSK